MLKHRSRFIKQIGLLVQGDEITCDKKIYINGKKSNIAYIEIAQLYLL